VCYWRPPQPHDPNGKVCGGLPASTAGSALSAADQDPAVWAERNAYDSGTRTRHCTKTSPQLIVIRNPQSAIPHIPASALPNPCYHIREV
jgi:hypothetical protein